MDSCVEDRRYIEFSQFTVMVMTSLAAVLALASIDKQVVHTPWWPPGSEATSESVGIVSRGRIFMTAMMELNATNAKSVHQELSDVADIATAAGTNLSGLVSCLVNAPAKQSAQIRALFEADPSWPTHIALTVAEMVGEYSGMFPFQLQCTGVQPALAPVRTVSRGSRSRAVIAGGIAEVAVRASSATDALSETRALLTTGLDDVLSCTALVRNGRQGEIDATELRAALRAIAVPAALTIVHAPTAEVGSNEELMSLACTAKTDEAAPGDTAGVKGSGGAYAVVDHTHGLVYVDGLHITDANATGAFDHLASVLEAAGTDLSRVLACRFYLSELPAAGYPVKLFAGFQKLFCEANPPPPTRAEYVAAAVATEPRDGMEAGGEVSGAPGLIAQCTAALPVREELGL